MKERPILFSAPMVRALLAGTKTQTRRIVKPNAWVEETDADIHGQEVTTGSCIDESRCPYGQPGDRLWVRETHAVHSRYCEGQGIGYTLGFGAGGPDRELDPDTSVNPTFTRFPHQKIADKGWKPSIHMPRWASRITLEISGVRVERLQAISEQDAQAEGVAGEGGLWAMPLRPDGCCRVTTSAREAYAGLWDMINGAGAWEENPWVWAITFARSAS